MAIEVTGVAAVGIVWIRCSPDMELLLVDGGKSTCILMQGDYIIVAKTNQTT